MKLGVSNNTLKSINTSEPNDSKRYLCNMLEHCLKSRENLTWKELCECLQSPVVDCSHVAQEIEDWLCPNETEGMFIVWCQHSCSDTCMHVIKC